MKELSALQIRKFTTLFQHYDRTRSHYLELRDFISFAEGACSVFGWREHEPHFAEKKLSALKQRQQALFFRLLSAADKDQNSKISLSEFLAYYHYHALECQNMGIASPWLKESCWEMMQLFDRNGSFSLNSAEYSKYLLAMGSDADPVSAFARLDKAGKGDLNLHDLEVLALEFVLSDDPDAPGNFLYCGKI